MARPPDGGMRRDGPRGGFAAEHYCAPALSKRVPESRTQRATPPRRQFITRGAAAWAVPPAGRHRVIGSVEGRSAVWRYSPSVTSANSVAGKGN